MSKTCLMILGMHRSGTSALGGVLQVLGVSMGKKTIAPDENNPKGYFENENIVFFNDTRLFPFLGTFWDRIELLDVEKIYQDIPKKLVEEAKQIIKEDYQDSDIFGIKDPRMCILFPFWKKILQDLNIEIKCILPYRNPFEVANSLKVRDNFYIEKGLLLWAKYVLYAEYYSRSYKRVFVGYDTLLNSTYQTIKKIEKSLDISFPIPVEKAENTIDGFLDKRLKHHNIQKTYQQEPLTEFIIDIAKLYEYLINSDIPIPDDIIFKFDSMREKYKDFLNIPNFYQIADSGSNIFTALFSNRAKNNIKDTVSNYKKIAIYGAGTLGNMLYAAYRDVLSDKVCCFLDDNLKDTVIMDKPVIKPKGIPKDIDLIIISPQSEKAYESMKQRVDGKNVIWLKDLVF
ncbi:MAG: hypothetical protein RXR65_03005 [Hydrogenobaculum sp.]